MRVLKPGAPLLAFGGTRTYHRLACAVEDAGFELRDCLMWLYGQGFPKSHDISKAIDKAAGVSMETRGHFEYTAADAENVTAGAYRTNEERRNPGCHKAAPATDAAKQWDGWGTALKPAWEPVLVAMKPLDGTFAQNALEHGVAGLNIDGARVGTETRTNPATSKQGTPCYGDFKGAPARECSGRWPANLILSHVPPDENGEGGCRRVGVRKVKGSFLDHKCSRQDTSQVPFTVKGTSQHRQGYASPDGTEEVEAWECVEDCPVRLLDEQSGERPGATNKTPVMNAEGDGNRVSGGKGYRPMTRDVAYRDIGGASRFFYQAKASRGEREAGLRGRLPCVKCGGLDSEFHVTQRSTGRETIVHRLWRAGRNGVPSLARIRANSRRRRYRFRLVRCVRNHHPTVKPLGLMEYLLKLTSTPAGGPLLDPFAGSGSTLVAAKRLGIRAVGIEQDPASCEIIKARLAAEQ